MNHECKWGIFESLGDELHLKEKKLVLNYVLYGVKREKGAKLNI